MRAHRQPEADRERAPRDEAAGPEVLPRVLPGVRPAGGRGSEPGERRHDGRRTTPRGGATVVLQPGLVHGTRRVDEAAEGNDHAHSEVNETEIFVCVQCSEAIERVLICDSAICRQLMVSASRDCN